MIPVLSYAHAFCPNNNLVDFSTVQSAVWRHPWSIMVDHFHSTIASVSLHQNTLPVARFALSLDKSSFRSPWKFVSKTNALCISDSTPAMTANVCAIPQCHTACLKPAPLSGRFLCRLRLSCYFFKLFMLFSTVSCIILLNNIAKRGSEIQWGSFLNICLCFYWAGAGLYRNNKT